MIKKYCKNVYYYYLCIFIYKSYTYMFFNFLINVYNIINNINQILNLNKIYNNGINGINKL